MSEQNFPPFYSGQKVVCLVNAYKTPKGTVVKVLDCFRHCCKWHVDIGLVSPGDYYFVCNHCGSPLIYKRGDRLCPEAVCFAPIEPQFQSIKLSKVLEQETELISEN